jgi:hypothetical protein
VSPEEKRITSLLINENRIFMRLYNEGMSAIDALVASREWARLSDHWQKNMIKAALPDGDNGKGNSKAK